MAEGQEPIGLRADFSQVVACDITAAADVDWRTLVPGGRQAQPA